MQTTLETNLAEVRRRIAVAARGAGRDPSEIRLLAVTKTETAERAAEILRLGQAELGESRADELSRKAAWFREHGLRARWHFVGHVQRNKARHIVASADAIHSVDGLPVLETLERAAHEIERDLEVFVQVKLWPEETKSGLEPDGVPAVLERALACRHLRLAGLMTMAPLVRVATGAPGALGALGTAVTSDSRSPAATGSAREDAARTVFRRLASLARELASLFPRPPLLSMGMTDDFEIAIEEGSHIVRIGGALFAGLPAREAGA